MNSLIVFIFFMFNQVLKAKRTSFEYGILKTLNRDNGLENKYCYTYFDGSAPIPNGEDFVVFDNINDETRWDPCQNSSLPNDNIVNRLVLIKVNVSCSVFNISIVLQDAGAKGTIFVASKWKEYVNITDDSLNVGIISNEDYKKISKEMINGTVVAGPYKSESRQKFFDKYSPLILIWVMAVFSIIVGSYWSAVVRNSLYEMEQQLLTGEMISAERRVPKEPQDEISLKLTPKIVVIIVVTMCLILVGMWFLLQYVVYFLIVIFCMATARAVYFCFEPLLFYIPICKCRTPYFNIYLVRGYLELRQIVLLLVSLTIPIIWFVFRKHPWGWMLQDFLGILFCINVMVKIRLPNLMICTLLLTLLVLYDIFFVFITPFITPGGTSIMVDVARGAMSGEELPMLLKVPLFVYPEFYDYCHVRYYNSLGFGDILVPGLLVSYVHSFDLKAKTPFKLYYVIGVISYGFGLLITFIGLYMMAAAQPALFYLVPSLLIPAVVVAAVRGELAAMWSDSNTISKTNSETEENQAEERPPYQGMISEDPLICTTPSSLVQKEDSCQDNV